MSDEVCIECQKPKANLICEICDEPVCKKCVQILDESTFSFMSEIPEDLSHTRYCGGCYDRIVASELDAYQEIMERAKDVLVFFKTQRRAIPIIDQSKELYRVEKIKDRDEAILRLAFKAASENYNAIIHVLVESEQVRHHAYANYIWYASGRGANVDREKVELDDDREEHYR